MIRLFRNNTYYLYLVEKINEDVRDRDGKYIGTWVSCSWGRDKKTRFFHEIFIDHKEIFCPD